MLQRFIKSSVEGVVMGVVLSCFQAVVPALSGVLQGFMMSSVVGVVCPELQDNLLQVFAEVDPPNSRVGAQPDSGVVP